MSGSIRSFCIIADDLSGAADCAAAFAPVAGPVPVHLGEVAETNECLALDTDSRTMELTQALAVTTRVFERFARGSAADRLIYKKIDSTLRGHVAAELDAALHAAPEFAAAIIAPAFPEQGRTYEGGHLLVRGRPAENLGHLGDLMGMLHMSGLRASLVKQEQQGSPEQPSLGRRIADGIRSGARAVVVDAADRPDLDRLARALCSDEVPRVLVVGSAGLARSLAGHLERRPLPAPEPVRAGRPLMAVVGSFSKASQGQVQSVQDAGVAQVIRLEAGQWLDPQHAARRQMALVIARDHLRSGRNVLFAVGGEPAPPFSRSMVRAMARFTAPLLEHASTCVLTGGDTARAMFNELGVERLDIFGEFEPGISLARAACVPAAAFVLKAGAFGDALVLVRLIQRCGAAGFPPSSSAAAPS